MKLTADGFIIRETKTTKTIAEYGGGFGLSVNVIGVTLSWATANGETIYQFSPQTFEIKSQANTTTISARNARKDVDLDNLNTQWKEACKARGANSPAPIKYDDLGQLHAWSRQGLKPWLTM